MNKPKKSNRKRKPKPDPGKRLPAIQDAPQKSLSTVVSSVAATTNNNRDNGSEKKPPARFELFVVLRAGRISPFRDLKTQWCFRGDKYTDQEPMMLRKLLTLMKNKADEYYLMVLMDTSYAKDDERRVVLKVQDRKIKCGERFKEYADMLIGYPVPESLKPLLQ